MKKVDLEKRIKELENLIEQKDLLIQQLQIQLNNQNLYNPLNEDLCIDGKPHDYPNPWFGVIPPHCKKCGKQAQQMEITFQTNNTGTQIDFEQFGGNMMYSQRNIS